MYVKEDAHLTIRSTSKDYVAYMLSKSKVKFVEKYLTSFNLIFFVYEIMILRRSCFK